MCKMNCTSTNIFTLISSVWCTCSMYTFSLLSSVTRCLKKFLFSCETNFTTSTEHPIINFTLFNDGLYIPIICLFLDFWKYLSHLLISFAIILDTLHLWTRQEPCCARIQGLPEFAFLIFKIDISIVQREAFLPNVNKTIILILCLKLYKQAEKLKSREMNDEGWMMNDESWRMKD